MSMSKLYKIYSPYSVKLAISPFVSAKQLRQIDRLSDWLRREKQKRDWSFPEIARRSGGLVSQGAASDIVNKRYDSFDPRTVKGLAIAFEITEQELWDIVNGAVSMAEPVYETREVALPETLWRTLDSEARRVKRNWGQLLEALLIAYFGVDVNLDLNRLKEIRRDAVIIPLNAGGEGDVPFTRESDQAKKRSAKPLSKRK